MKRSSRFLLAVVLVLTDTVVVLLPLGALFAAYVLVVRPPFFRNWVARLYEDG